MTDAAALPYLDEHAVVVTASRTATWAALLGMVEGTGSSWFVRLLGAVDAAPSGPRPLGVGSTVPGFRVVVADEPAELALAGRHRHSDYLLTFRLEDASDGRTRLAAVSRAAFPGRAGGRTLPDARDRHAGARARDPPDARGGQAARGSRLTHALSRRRARPRARRSR